MAPHSSTRAWKIPWTEEPGRLQYMWSLRVVHEWVTSLSFFTFMHWRRQWHPTPVLLPGKSHGWRSLVGCSPWSREESDTTEQLHFHFSLPCIGEGTGTPLQCSCLENPRDGGAWWAAVYGVAQSQTWLKWLSSSSSMLYICCPCTLYVHTCMLYMHVKCICVICVCYMLTFYWWCWFSSPSFTLPGAFASLILQCTYIMILFV